MNDLTGARIHITGIVQGVGFRPFIYGLAKHFGLPGWVRNTSAGVDIEIDGPLSSLHAFVSAIENEAPPLAHIDNLQVEYCAPGGFSSFEITHSQPVPDAFQPISPDMSICEDCLRELFDPADRRYLYPFINCTNCGPRYTIIQDIPYDRPKTTMSAFPLCPTCTAEYQNPLDRRFHAQPVACPDCGPKVWLEGPSDLLSAAGPFLQPANPNVVQSAAAIFTAQRLLVQGKIIAIKGLGGFHLACDAQNRQAVAELRQRKLRVDKPFALMAPDLETIQKHCALNQAESQLLNSHQRPIVLLERLPGSPIAAQAAPGQSTLGIMLPYTPLHYLLFSQNPADPAQTPPPVLVMTSGNLSEEPIAIDNDEARQRLSHLADAFLMHDRPIRTRCDDSVVRIFQISKKQSILPTIQTMPIRRSRGYAPFPIHLPYPVPPMIAVGAELKNAFCVTREQYAFMSQHIGDMENFETLRSFEDGIQHVERLFRIHPQAIAHDLHPNYLATRYALERAKQAGIPAIGVQHHHAHIAACMAEHELPRDKQVIGVSFDGTGYGEDGAIWGGEFLIANYREYQRPYHLEYIPLPGADKAIREPWRMALAWLAQAGIAWTEDLAPVQYALQNLPAASQPLETLSSQIRNRINAPLTSSVGRLFDAVAALVGIRQSVNYEAQAAIELENQCDPQEQNHYPAGSIFENHTGNNLSQPISPDNLIQAIVDDLRKGTSVSTIAARFHNSLAQIVTQVCCMLRDQYGINDVALSGGVWQNTTLLQKTVIALQAEKFMLYLHQQVPTNDGGIALGQAIIAANRLD